MNVRQVQESELKSFGEVDLNASEVMPAYRDLLEVYNFTEENILFINGEGNMFELPSTSHDMYMGKIIIRREVQWANGGKWLRQLNTNSTISPEVLVALEDYYGRANKYDSLIKNGGHHTCKYDVVLELPSVDAEYNGVTSSFPNVTFGRLDGKRTVEMLHDEKHQLKDTTVGLKETIPLGVVVEENLVAVGDGVVHVLNMFIRVKRIISAGRLPGTLVCMITGSTLYEPGTVVSEEGLGLYASVAEALSQVRLEATESFDTREIDTFKSLVQQTEAEAEDKLRSMKHDLQLDMHNLKREALISDMAASQLMIESKIDADNFKAVTGIVMNLLK